MTFYTTSATYILVDLVTGVFLLLYGVRLVSDALQRVISGSMQELVTRLSKHPFAVFGMGILGTAIVQSSAATTSLLVELVGGGLLPLSVAIVMMLGANVGSTLVVQLLVLHITRFAFDMFAVGIAIALFTHRTRYRRSGRGPLAFSMIVLGLAAIEAGTGPLASGPLMKDVFSQQLASAPLVLLVIGAFIAVLFNSSAATIGVVITIAATGAVAPVPALVLMLGANIGTTLITMLAALSQGTLAGRRLAMVYTGTKLLGAIIVLLLIQPLAGFLIQFVPNAGTQVALTHMGFNLALAIVFGPFVTPLARLAEYLMPDRVERTVGVPVPHTLDPEALDTPAIAQGLATREILRMADIVTTMFELSMRAFKERPNTIQARIESMDDELDELNAAIKGYLTLLDERKMSGEEAHRDITLLTIVGDLEAIGDVITHRFMSLARRRLHGNIQFSEEAQEDLIRYHRQIKEALQQVLAALAAHNPMLVTQFLERREELNGMKRHLHQRHIRQLRAQIPTSTKSSAVYLDLLDALSAVLAYTSNIAYALQEANDLPRLTTGTFRNLRQFIPSKMVNTEQLYAASQAELAQNGRVLED